MLWKPVDFHPVAFSILEAHSGKPIPLSADEFQPQDLPSNVMSTAPESLFPHARDAKAALSGLLLMAGHWDLSHQIAQELPSREGSYWHAIAHRVEPDTSNADYWFNRVGEHAIFTALHEQAKALLALSNVGWHAKNRWDPHEFLTWCEEARPASGSMKYRCAEQIQRAECDLLFSWCALKIMDL